MGLILSAATIFAAPNVEKSGHIYEGKVSYFHADRSSALFRAHTAVTGKEPIKLPERYCACRWNYNRLKRFWGLPASWTRDQVKNHLYENYKVFVWRKGDAFKEAGRMSVQPLDAGPARWTGRAIDLDQDTFNDLGVKTDEEVRFELVRRLKPKGD